MIHSGAGAGGRDQSVPEACGNANRQGTTTGRVSTGRACLTLEARGPYQEVAHGLPTEAARTRAGPASLLQEVVTPREPVQGSSLFLESLVGAHPLQEALSASPLSPGQLQQQWLYPRRGAGGGGRALLKVEWGQDRKRVPEAS